MHELCTLTNSIQTALVPFGPLPSITKMENHQSAHVTIELYCVSFSTFLSYPCDMVLTPDRLAANSSYRWSHLEKCVHKKGILPQCSRPFCFHRLELQYPQQIVVLKSHCVGLQLHIIIKKSTCWQLLFHNRWALHFSLPGFANSIKSKFCRTIY